MCGIVGAFRAQGPVCDDSTLIRMRDRMQHRGPDGGGLWRDGRDRCVLGHRRLSIIDLSAAASQPMTNHDASVVLVFNGEIYNHAEIRRELQALGKYQWKTDHSDTEVLLHAYEEWGPDCVARFHGDFAFAVFDARDPERPLLHLARDRVGVKPLYFARTGRGEWLFASEIRALLAHEQISAEIDRAAFWHYLTFIVTPAPLTLFRGIFKLPAGWRMTIDHRGVARAEQYWDCRPDQYDRLPDDLPDDEVVSELTTRLRTSIARRMVSDVPFGVLLSGGVDSSMNVALMSELMDRPVTTFTVGYRGHEDFNEFQFARQISRRYGTDHHEALIDRQQVQEFLPQLVRLQDEPIADNVCIPLYFLAKLVRDSGTTVIQVGEGADENFLGYWWCEHYRAKQESVYDPARHALRGPKWLRLLRRARATVPAITSAEDREFQRRAASGEELFWGGAVCWHGEMRERLTPTSDPFRQKVDCPVENLLPDSFDETNSHRVVEQYFGDLNSGRFSVLEKIPYMEMKLRLPEHLLMRVDKLTMCHSIEARVPFLDHDVVEFATRLPARYKLRDGIGKFCLKRAAEPHLDREIVYRKKQGFGAPIERWFQEGDFGRRCIAAYERSELRQQGFFDDSYVRDLLRQQTEGSGGYSFHLWTLLNAVLWHASWIERREDCF